MPHRKLPTRGHDGDRHSEGRAWWDRASANESWAERRAIVADPVAGADDQALPLQTGQALVRNSHLTRLAAALEQSRRLQVPRIRAHLRVVPAGCK